MQLTHFTDLGLRVLMYLSHPRRDTPVTISEVAERFGASRHHLVKVVHFMGQQGWLVTTRGKGGGLALANPLSHYRLGATIRTLEHVNQLIDCSDPPCVLQGYCHLKSILDEAMERFFQQLDRYTLADAVGAPTSQVIKMLHRLRPVP